MHHLKSFFLLFLLFITGSSIAEIDTIPLSGEEQAAELSHNTKKEAILGINTADVREDTSSVQFLNLFKTAIPFNQTIPWGSSKKVEYDKNGWPTKLNGGQAGTKFLNRLPEGTVEDGFFTVLYDGEGTIFYGNDARLVVHRPNKDIIEIKAGKDHILNASLFIKKSNPKNYIRNIRILPEGGICKGNPFVRVKVAADCDSTEFLSFEDYHLNVDKLSENEIQKINDAREKKKKEEEKSDKKEASKKDTTKTVTAETKEKEQSDDENDAESENNITEDIDNTIEEDSVEDDSEAPPPIQKGKKDIKDAIVFNPDYLNFMKDFQVIRFMNMSGMTRNPVTKWNKRNTLHKATWGGKYGSRGAPVEVMVALANELKADPWFSMPYKASNDYIREFAKYVKEHLNPALKVYIEYSNEVWNPIFIHHDYAIAQGLKAKLDKRKSPAGYKWYSRRSVKTFKIWEKVFGGHQQLIRVMGSWASNQAMSSTILAYKNAYKHTDALAIGPYVSAHPKVLRRAKTVNDVFKAMLDKKSKWGMRSTINYIKKQAKVAKSFGVDLIAYEGGQHLVDWNTRKAEQHPNPLLYAANRDPRMGIIYDELMREWHRAGGKLFVAFSAPRIYSWYGSWGIKEHIRQARSKAPKYDALLRYLDKRLNPQAEEVNETSKQTLAALAGEIPEIPVYYAKNPHQIWNVSRLRSIPSEPDNSPNNISAKWQANWDSKHLYFSFAITDDDLQEGDKILLSLDTSPDKEVTVAETKNKSTQTQKAEKGKEKEKKTTEKVKTADKEKTIPSKKKTSASSHEEKEDNDKSAITTEINKEIENELKTALKGSDKKTGADSKEKKSKDTTDKTKTTEIEKKDKIPDQKITANKTDNKSKETATNVTVDSKEKEDKKEAQATDEVKENTTEENKHIKNFTFSLLDSPLEKTYMIPTDTGYLLNVAIPWSEIYSGKKEVSAKTGDNIKINISVTDIDQDDKNPRLLKLAKDNDPLPKIILENTPKEPTRE